MTKRELKRWAVGIAMVTTALLILTTCTMASRAYLNEAVEQRREFNNIYTLGVVQGVCEVRLGAMIRKYSPETQAKIEALAMEVCP